MSDGVALVTVARTSRLLLAGATALLFACPAEIPVLELRWREELQSHAEQVLIPLAREAPGRAALLEQRLAPLRRLADERFGPRPPGPTPLARLDHDALAGAIEAGVAEQLAYAEDAQLGISVRDVWSGAVLYERNPDLRLNPASNQKLLVSAAALDLLGPSFAYETTLEAHAGTLFVVGSGDPVLETENVEAMLESVEEDALSEVERVVFDDTAFSARLFAPGFDADGDGLAYAPPSGALSLDFNTVLLWGRTRGSRIEFDLYPDSSMVALETDVVRGRRTRLQVRTAVDELMTRVSVQGTFRRRRYPYVTRRRVGHPGAFAAGVVAKLLTDHGGGDTPQVMPGPVAAEAQLLAVHRSPALGDIVKLQLGYSTNLISEQLFRTLGAEFTDEPGSWKNGARVLRAYLDAIGIDSTAVAFETGAGLSGAGRISAGALAELLIFHRMRALASQLARPGDPGTLERRLRRHRSRVRAKTGTLDHAVALSGYVLDDGGIRPLAAFSILVNSRDPEEALPRGRMRRMQDAIVDALVDAVDGATGRAR